VYSKEDPSPTSGEAPSTPKVKKGGVWGGVGGYRNETRKIKGDGNRARTKDF